MSPGPRIFTGAVVVVAVRPGETGGRETLLVRRTQAPLAGEWLYLTGRIEDGERASECAARETLEETGLVPRRLASANMAVPFHALDSETIGLFPVFVAEFARSDAVRLSAEASAFAWLDFAAARARVPVAAARQVLLQVETQVLAYPPEPALAVDPRSGAPLAGDSGRD